jgi:hypothetical protein
MPRISILLLVAAAFAVAACKSLPEDRGSEFAINAKDHTVVIGTTGAQLGPGCQEPIEKGWKGCQIVEGAPLPTLTLLFTNPGSYAVGDCEFGLFKTGQAQPGMTEIDLGPLNDQVKKNGFCLLKIEVKEFYPDGRDKNQIHEIPMAGGFFIEALPAAYFPVPTPEVVAWCRKVYRTTKGRTVVEECKEGRTGD